MVSPSHILIFSIFFSCSRCNGRPESNFHSVLQEAETGLDSSNNSQIQKDWSPNNFSSAGGSQVSTVDAFKPMNQEFSMDQQSLSSGGFPIASASYGYPSTLMQGLYDPDPQPQPQPQPQNSLFTNQPMSYSSTANYGTSSTELSPTWSTVSSLLKPSMQPKQQLSGLHFSNNTPFWNASAEALRDIRAGVFSSSSQAQYQTPTFDDKPNCPSTPLNKVINYGFQV